MNNVVTIVVKRGPQMAQERPAVEDKVDTQYVSKEAFIVFVNELKESMQTIVEGLKYMSGNQAELAKGIELVNKNVLNIQNTLEQMCAEEDNVSSECPGCEYCQEECEDGCAEEEKAQEQQPITQDKFIVDLFSFVDTLEKINTQSK